MSASDDRSVRVWTVTLPTTVQANVQQQGTVTMTGTGQADVKQQGTASPKAAPVLYGHSARLWDCQFGQGILITASEDCTAR